MPQNNNYMSIANFNKEQIHVNHRIQGSKEKIVVTYGEAMRSLAFEQQRRADMERWQQMKTAQSLFKPLPLS